MGQLTDETYEKCVKAIAECEDRIDEYDVCRALTLPCSQGIDKGKCPTIIEIIKEEAK